VSKSRHRKHAKLDSPANEVSTHPSLGDHPSWRLARPPALSKAEQCKYKLNNTRQATHASETSGDHYPAEFRIILIIVRIIIVIIIK
jgi:hypothetical protein